MTQPRDQSPLRFFLQARLGYQKKDLEEAKALAIFYLFLSAHGSVKDYQSDGYYGIGRKFQAQAAAAQAELAGTNPDGVKFGDGDENNLFWLNSDSLSFFVCSTVVCVVLAKKGQSAS